MNKLNKNEQLRGTKVVVKYALKSSNKLFIFCYLCSLIKLYCTKSPYFLKKFICLQPFFFKKKK